MDKTVHIRRATPQDSAGVAQVQVDSYRRAYAGIVPQPELDRFSYPQQEQDWRDWIASRPDDLLYVAETESGDIVGYALARPGPTEIPPYDAELISLHVDRPHQRRGLGRRLVAAVAGELATRGSRSLMLWVLERNPARGFYERLGAHPLNARQIGFGGRPEVAYGWPVIARLIK